MAPVTSRNVWTFAAMIVLFVVALLLVSCGTRHQGVYRTEPIRYYPLLAPSSYGSPLTVEQFIEGWFKEKHFQIHSQLEIDAQRMFVLGLTTLGTKAFSLRYDGKTIEFVNFTNHKLPFPPELILSDIQKALWPALPNQDGWTIADNSTAKERSIFFEGVLLTHIQYRGLSPLGGDIELIDLQYGYRLSIRTLNVWGG